MKLSLWQFTLLLTLVSIIFSIWLKFVDARREK